MAKTNREFDLRLDKAFGRALHGVQINVMDISKITAAGRTAILEGKDDAGLEQALKDAAVACGCKLQEDANG